MMSVFKSKDIFCCAGFKNRIEAAGGRGIAILANQTATGVIFLLQSRGIAFEDVKRIEPNSDLPDITINVSYEVGLQYCPWCGRQLQELVDASPAAFEQLANNNRCFLMK